MHIYPEENSEKQLHFSEKLFHITILLGEVATHQDSIVNLHAHTQVQSKLRTGSLNLGIFTPTTSDRAQLGRRLRSCDYKNLV